MNSFLRQYAAIALTRHLEGTARRERGRHHRPYDGRRRDRLSGSR
jgi:hypothetical protein